MLVRAGLALVLPVIAATAVAEKPRFGDSFSFGLGGMSHRADGSFSSTREGEMVDELSLDDLGLDDEASVVWGEFAWQFAERWRFAVNYSSFSADGFVVDGDGGNFGDLEWEVGARLDTDFDLDLYIADIHWDFLKTDTAHLGIGLGLHIADIDFALNARAFGGIGGIGGEIDLGTESADVTAPLPNLSVSGGWRFTEKLYLSGTLGYFSLQYDKYDGALTSARASLEWRPWKNVGLGGALQYVDVNVKVDQSDSVDRFDIAFSGPILFVSVGF